MRCVNPPAARDVVRTDRHRPLGHGHLDHEETDDDEGGPEQARVEVSGIPSAGKAGTVLPLFLRPVKSRPRYPTAFDERHARPTPPCDPAGLCRFHVLRERVGPTAGTVESPAPAAGREADSGNPRDHGRSRHDQSVANDRPDAPRPAGANHGMLFVFEDKAQQCFWMRNTIVPLTIAFIDDDGTHPATRGHGAAQRGQPLLPAAGALRAGDGAGLVRQARNCAGREGWRTARLPCR